MPCGCGAENLNVYEVGGGPSIPGVVEVDTSAGILWETRIVPGSEQHDVHGRWPTTYQVVADENGEPKRFERRGAFEVRCDLHGLLPKLRFAELLLRAATKLWFKVRYGVSIRQSPKMTAPSLKRALFGRRQAYESTEFSAVQMSVTDTCRQG